MKGEGEKRTRKKRKKKKKRGSIEREMRAKEIFGKRNQTAEGGKGVSANFHKGQKKEKGNWGELKRFIRWGPRSTHSCSNRSIGTVLLKLFGLVGWLICRGLRRERASDKEDEEKDKVENIMISSSVAGKKESKKERRQGHGRQAKEKDKRKRIGESEKSEEQRRYARNKTLWRKVAFFLVLFKILFLFAFVCVSCVSFWR